MRLRWSRSKTRVPEPINSQLLGTFPTIVQDDDGTTSCAFFVRSAEQEFLTAAFSKESVFCVLKPRFVRTPQGPIVVAYCMVSSGGEASETFISETALFPRLTALPEHKEIVDLLLSGSEAYYVVCDVEGKCMFNSKARVLTEWRSELKESARGFDEGKQVTDEKSAIMSLYWYQERYNTSSKIFEVSN